MLLSNVDNTHRPYRPGRDDAWTPAELATALQDPATVVIAAGNSEDDFIAGHIPGARFVRYDDFAVTTAGLSSELPPVDQRLHVRDARVGHLLCRAPSRLRRANV